MSRKPTRSPEDAGSDAKIESQERLQKVLAAAGVGSRRDCEELITQGRVEIDRQVVTELGTKVDPLQHEIRVDGVALHRPKKLYFAVNKPEGVVTTNFDPSGRTRVIDLVPTEERVFAIGRLDRASEGLILVTNDGDLANRITHPRYGVEKIYHVRVEGTPDNEQLMRLRRGVHIAEGVARVQSVKVKSRHKHVSDLEIVLKEGKNREIRRILAKIGHKVLSLKRLAVGPVKLGELKVGNARKLMPQEIEALFEAARQHRKESKSKRKASPTAGGGPTGPKPVGGKRPEPLRIERPQPISSSAPPKIDLATLLNPALAPKHAMPVSPPPTTFTPPAIGDVLGYKDTDRDSLEPLQTPVRKRRRPLREYEADSEPIELIDNDKPAAPASAPGPRGRGNRGDRTGRARPPRSAGSGDRTERPRPSRAAGKPSSGDRAGRTRPPRPAGKPSGDDRREGGSSGRRHRPAAAKPAGFVKPGAKRGGRGRGARPGSSPSFAKSASGGRKFGKRKGRR